MTRREAREQAFCLLFQQTVSGDAMDEILGAAHEARDLVPDSFTEGGDRRHHRGQSKRLEHPAGIEGGPDPAAPDGVRDAL